MEESILKKLKNIITNRLVIFMLVLSIMFGALVMKFFEIQVINGEDYYKLLTSTTIQNITLDAPRGTINDRFGRPLAENKSAYIVKIDPSISIYDNSELLRANDVLYGLVKLFESNGESYVEDFPISKEMPYSFMFSGSEAREERWKLDMDISVDLSAAEAFTALREKFKIDPTLPDTEAWKILNLRTMVYMYRYQQYKSISIAFDVKTDTLTEIEEHNEKYPSIYIDMEPMRRYPHADYFAHILGYVGNITDAELESFKNKDPDTPYTRTDKIGKSGLERSMEEYLKGIRGQMTVEATPLGRPIRRLDTVQPTQGDKLFLTLDIDLQRETSRIVTEMLKQTIVNKLLSTDKREEPITIPQILASMIRNNQLSLNRILLAEEGEFSYDLKHYIYENIPDASITAGTSNDKVDEIKELLAQGVELGHITPKTVLLAMYEQGVITADENYLNNMVSGAHSSLKVILDKIQQDEITPQMMNVDPSTASAVVLDLENNSVLASVNYPSYDNNQLVNNFNNSYYIKLSNDLTYPMINRAFMEPRAPGSTFKMITAIAGLEYGVITPRRLIYDDVVFEKAGAPYTRNWSIYSYGDINVEKALEVSCNYFFCEVAYRMGNKKMGNTLVGINVLMKYMDAFGLNGPTGVEIGEWYYSAISSDYSNPDIPVTSSPEYKEYIFKSRNPNATSWDYDWYDGDTVKTSIGQGYNNYTTASMAKYIATLATGGKRYSLHFLDRIETQQGETVKEYVPNLEETVHISPENLAAVYNGMLKVIEGPDGTGRHVFADFPIRVAGKTGTAEEQRGFRNNHTSFGGFAPYENPKIAVYVTIPFGDTVTTPAPSAQVARDIIAYYMGVNAEPQRGQAENTLAK